MSAKGNSFAKMVLDYMSLNLRTKFIIKRSYDDWAIRQMFADKKRRVYLGAQSLNLDNYARLGPDLAASYFITSVLKGRVRDQNGAWISRSRDLPQDFDESYKLTGIEAINTSLVSEGVDNLACLENLESLDLSKNPELDDFACDQLSRQFLTSRTLKAIDLSYNPLISVYGLETLLRIPSLRSIVASNTAASAFPAIDLFTLAAEDECDCQVFVHEQGRQFRLPELEENKVAGYLGRTSRLA